MGRVQPIVSQRRRKKFLEALSQAGVVTEAARIAGVQTARMYEVRAKDAAFAAGWDAAIEKSVDLAETEARRRAIEGVLEPVVSMGKLVRDEETGEPLLMRRYSDRLLERILTGRRSSVYGTKTVHVEGAVNHNIIPSPSSMTFLAELQRQVAGNAEAKAALSAALLAMSGRTVDALPAVSIASNGN